MIRLGDGTDESKKRLQEAIQERWMFTGELFQPSDADKQMLQTGGGVDLEALKEDWKKKVIEIATEATVSLPENNWMQEGGKPGIHSEHLCYLLAEMQHMQRAYPGMEW